METFGQYENVRMCHFAAGHGFICEIPKSGFSKPRLLDRVREEIRQRHYSRRTEKTYAG